MAEPAPQIEEEAPVVRADVDGVFVAHVEMEEIGDLEARLEEDASEDSSLEDSEDMDNLSVEDEASPSHVPKGIIVH